MEISVIETNNSGDPIPRDLSNKTAGWRLCCKKLALCLIPSSATVNKLVTQILILFLITGTSWALFQEQTKPNGPIFALLLLVVLCYCTGLFVTIIKLPALVGMLIAGFMFRNIPNIHYYQDIPHKWTFILRNSALVVILLRAGLGLDPKVLKKLSFACLRLAICPCIIEAVATSVASFYLFKFPWSWSFCLGFILAAVSPAVVIPSMLLLEEEGLGKDKGIPTLIIAAASIDDVFAITGFGLSLGIAFSKDSLVWTFIKGPLEVLVGLTFGAVMGVLCWYFPSPSHDRKVFYRVVILTFGGLGATFVSVSLDFPAAGAIACLSLSFVAALRWREENDLNISVCEAENGLWLLLQIFLFGLIGAEVSISDLRKDIGFGIVVVLFGLLFRIFTAYIALIRTDLNSKEKIFVAVAWLPKATVQAAIGSVTLDLALTLGLEDDIVNQGKQILTVAVLSIMLTAPIGAVAIAILAPILLQKSGFSETKNSTNENLTFHQKTDVDTKITPENSAHEIIIGKSRHVELSEAII